MVESIKKYGIITPLIVKKSEQAYQILSGHNRANAAKIAGLKHIKAVIVLDTVFENNGSDYQVDGEMSFDEYKYKG